MIKNKVSNFFSYLCFLLFVSVNSDAQDADVRISWDKNSYRELESYLVSGSSTASKTAYYPRIKRLQDGSLLMVFMNAQTGYNIYTRRSVDDGKNWSNASLIRKQYNEASQTSASDKMVFACPDFIELDNGEILLAYQWRYNSAYSNVTYTNVSCGIELMRSTDYGQTWSAPRKMYYGRNWEPSFIKLPSGELQMIFTDSHEVTAESKSRPCVSMLRSFDKGLTWQNKETCSYEDAIVLSRTVDANGTYDGMPVGKYLANNNGIAYACESWGAATTPWIVYSSVDENWNYNDFDFASGGPGADRKWAVHENFVGYAPYMEVLPTGEVIVQGNGKYNGTSGIWAFIGDKFAKNFSYASSPYTGWWGSIAYIGNNELISTSNYDYKVGSLSYEGLKLIKGKLNYAKTILRSTIDMQPLSSFDRNLHNDWYIGEKSSSSAYVNFGYTAKSFDYTVHLFDSIITAFTPANSDAVVLRLNRTNQITGVSKNYQLTANALGVFSLEEKINYTWTSKDVSSVDDIFVNLNGTVNNASDVDLGYAVKVSVPWNLIGGYPSEYEVFRVHLRQRYKDTVTESPSAVVASLAGENPDDSSTWLKIGFDFSSGVDDIETDVRTDVFIWDDNVFVPRPDQIDLISIYTLSGQKMIDIYPVEQQNNIKLPKGAYILKCHKTTGCYENIKVLLK